MLHYSTYTNSKSKPWVTFVHGAGGSSSIWFKQIKEFSKHFNVLMVDLRGHGKSKRSFLNAFKKKFSYVFIDKSYIQKKKNLMISMT